MKTLMLAALALGVAGASLPAHALVMVVDQCRTSSGDYHLLILNEEGIGFDRTPRYSARISRDDGQVVGSFEVKPVREIQSASFGRPQYVDVQTEGHVFHLSYPSTNEGNTILKATLSDGTVISDGNLSCDR